MKRVNQFTAAARRTHKTRNYEAARINEVARQANVLQKQGMTRTEALRLAERTIPHIH